MSTINNSSLICIDANLPLRILLGGPHRQEVRDQWNQWVEAKTTLIAPPLFAFEVTSVLWQQVFHKLLTFEKGQQALSKVFDQGIRIEYPSNLHKHAWEFAQRFNLHAAYDAHYLALAEHFKGEFWTLDEKLYKIVGNELPWVHTISH